MTTTSPTEERGEAGGAFSPAYRLVTVSVLALVTIIGFESMGVSTVMPEVAHDLDAVRSYGLAFSVMLTAQLLGIVLAGVWVDRSGAFVPLIAGQFLLAIGLVLCGAALRLEMLLAGRALAGLGAGLLIVVSFVVIGRIYPPRVQPRPFGLISAAWVLPALLGPPGAAWIAGHLSWRWVFWIVVGPIVVIALLLLARSHLIGAAGQAVSSRDHAAHVRAAGLGLAIALAAGAVQLGTHELEPVLSPKTGLAIIGVIGMAVTAPLLLPAGTWLMRRGLPSVMLARFLSSWSFLGTVTFLPLYLVNERGLSIGVAGTMLAIGSLGWAAGSLIQSSSRWDGRRELLVSVGGLGLSAGVIGHALAAWLTLPVPLFPVLLVVMGLGMGLATSTSSVLTLALSSAAEHGQASTSLNLADVLGSVTAIAAGGAVFAALHVAAGQDATVFALIWTIVAVGAVLLVIAGRRIRSRG